MIRTRNYRYLIAAIVLSMLAAGWLVAATGVAGDWECISLTPDGDEIHSTLTVTEADGKITAKLLGDDGEWALSKVKFENNVLTFTVSRDADYNVTLNLNGDKMEGKWEGDGMGGKITATRRKA